MKTLIKILCLSVVLTFAFTEEISSEEYVCTVRDFSTDTRTRNNDPLFIQANLKKIFVLNVKKDTIEVTAICTDCIKKKSEYQYKIISEDTLGLDGLIAFRLGAKTNYKTWEKTIEVDYMDALTFDKEDKKGTMTMLGPNAKTWFLDCEGANEDFN